MKSYTDIEQSKKLAEILPLESADMCYILHASSDNPDWRFDNDIPPMVLGKISINELTVKALPCWSLAALLCILPFPVLYIEMVGGTILWCCECHFIETYEMVKMEHCNDPVDACVDLIEKLYKLNLFQL